MAVAPQLINLQTKEGSLIYIKEHTNNPYTVVEDPGFVTTVSFKQLAGESYTDVYQKPTLSGDKAGCLITDLHLVTSDAEVTCSTPCTDVIVDLSVAKTVSYQIKSFGGPGSSTLIHTSGVRTIQILANSSSFGINE